MNNWLTDTLLIFAAALALMLGAAALIGRGNRELARIRLLAALEAAEPAPFPAEPPLLVSEMLAAVEAHEREVREMIRMAERKIGPVQP